MPNFKVIIVGAGISGLGAAWALKQMGVEDICVLEAQNRIGGRIETVPVANGLVDIGAQWVHSTDTYLGELAAEHSLLSDVVSNEGTGVYVADDGYTYDDFLVRRVDFEVGRILQECEKFVDETTPNCPRSVGEYLTERFQNFVNSSSPTLHDELWELFGWHERFQVIDNSCSDLRRLSAKEWGRYSCLGKDGQAHVNLKRGYSSLIDVLLQEIDASTIRLQHVVQNIEYSANLHSKGNVIVSTENGLKFHANHVIVTVSLGVLKHTLHSMFSPQLPISLRQTIQAMGFGGMGKVFLLFDTRWWKSEGLQIIWRRHSSINNSCDDRKPTSRCWVRHISGFEPVFDQPNMLVGWVSADGCEVMEKLSECELGRDCVELIRRCLVDDKIPMPARVFRTTWCSNPYIRGAYSHTTTQCDELGVTAQTFEESAVVRDSAGVPRVVIAGEAVHATHFSTVHGAFESGVHQTRKLSDYFHCS